MAAKPVQLRERAAADLDSAADQHRNEADVAAVACFIDAVQRATRRINRNPQVGTLRCACELDIPELRSIPVDRFLYLAFYVERNDHTLRFCIVCKSLRSASWNLNVTGRCNAVPSTWNAV